MLSIMTQLSAVCGAGKLNMSYKNKKPIIACATFIAKLINNELGEETRINCNKLCRNPFNMPGQSRAGKLPAINYVESVVSP